MEHQAVPSHETFSIDPVFTPLLFPNSFPYFFIPDNLVHFIGILPAALQGPPSHIQCGMGELKMETEPS